MARATDRARRVAVPISLDPAAHDVGVVRRAGDIAHDPLRSSALPGASLDICDDRCRWIRKLRLCWWRNVCDRCSGCRSPLACKDRTYATVALRAGACGGGG